MGSSWAARRAGERPKSNLTVADVPKAMRTVAREKPVSPGVRGNGLGSLRLGQELFGDHHLLVLHPPCLCAKTPLISRAVGERSSSWATRTAISSMPEGSPSTGKRLRAAVIGI